MTRVESVNAISVLKDRITEKNLRVQSVVLPEL